MGPCDTFYPKPKWYSPFTWKYRKYAKFDYYSGPCEVKKEEHCLPFWGHPDDASEATWYTVTYASGGGGCHGRAKSGCSTAVMGGDASLGDDASDAGGDVGSLGLGTLPGTFLRTPSGKHSTYTPLSKRMSTSDAGGDLY